MHTSCMQGVGTTGLDESDPLFNTSGVLNWIEGGQCFEVTSSRRQWLLNRYLVSGMFRAHLTSETISAQPLHESCVLLDLAYCSTSTALASVFQISFRTNMFSFTRFCTRFACQPHFPRLELCQTITNTYILPPTNFGLGLNTLVMMFAGCRKRSDYKPAQK